MNSVNYISLVDRMIWINMVCWIMDVWDNFGESIELGELDEKNKLDEIGKLYELSDLD